METKNKTVFFIVENEFFIKGNRQLSTINAVVLHPTGEIRVFKANARISGKKGLTRKENVKYYWETKQMVEDLFRNINLEIEFGGFIRDDNDTHRFHETDPEPEEDEAWTEMRSAQYFTDIFHDVANCLKNIVDRENLLLKTIPYPFRNMPTEGYAHLLRTRDLETLQNDLNVNFQLNDDLRNVLEQLKEIVELADEPFNDEVKERISEIWESLIQFVSNLKRFFFFSTIVERDLSFCFLFC